MSIPKYIFQIAIGDIYFKRLPLNILKNNILFYNPDYIYEIYTEDSCIKFLKEYFPKYLDLFYIIERPQYKSDLMRYLILFIKGGIYIDIDMQLISSLDKIIEKTNYPEMIFTIGAHCQINEQGELSNGFIMSIPNQSIFLDAVSQLYINPNPLMFGDNIRYLYTLLKKSYPEINKYTRINNVFFLAECETNYGAHIINISPENTIVLSNGHGIIHPYPFDLMPDLNYFVYNSKIHTLINI